MVTKAVNSTNVSVNDAFAQLRLTMTALKLAEEIVNSLWNLLDQVSFRVR